MPELGARTVRRVSITELVFATLCHVLMGPTEADGADGVLLVGGAGAKGMGGG